MTRNLFTRKLSSIQDEVLLLGSMVENAIINAVNSLKNRDVKLAKTIYEEDQNINGKRFAIENAILITIATQNPMAKDLRQLAAMLDVISELERMGDYAKGIAKVTLRLESADIKLPITEIETMVELAIKMLHKALTAFIEDDTQTASKIPYEDDMVDQLYNDVYHHAVDIMMANPQHVDDANLIIWVGHNLERLADRVTNICERTIFVSTGELMELEVDEDEDEFGLEEV
jgi:phosphate transport system protein